MREYVYVTYANLHGEHVWTPVYIVCICVRVCVCLWRDSKTRVHGSSDEWFTSWTTTVPWEEIRCWIVLQKKKKKEKKEKKKTRNNDFCFCAEKTITITVHRVEASNTRKRNFRHRNPTVIGDSRVKKMRHVHKPGYVALTFLVTFIFSPFFRSSSTYFLRITITRVYYT